MVAVGGGTTGIVHFWLGNVAAFVAQVRACQELEVATGEKHEATLGAGTGVTTVVMIIVVPMEVAARMIGHVSDRAIGMKREAARVIPLCPGARLVTLPLTS